MARLDRQVRGREFVRSLLRLLNTYGKSQVDPTNSDMVFRNASAVLVAACDCSRLDREATLFGVIEMVAELVTERAERPVYGRHLAEFCVFVILSMRERQEEAFLRLIDARKSIAGTDVRSEEIAFMGTLIRIGISVPRFLAVMDDDVVQLLVLMRDVEAAAAFFSAKYPHLEE